MQQASNATYRVMNGDAETASQRECDDLVAPLSGDAHVADADNMSHFNPLSDPKAALI